MVSDDICVAAVEEWAEGLEEIGELIGQRFVRSEPRRNAVGYVRGLLSDEERKNSWTLSERARRDPGWHAAPALDHRLGPGCRAG